MASIIRELRCAISIVFALFLLPLRVMLAEPATVTATATLTVSASSAPNGSGQITVVINGLSEIVQYGIYSNANSIASAIGARFSRDYISGGLYAKADANGNTDSSVVTFQLTTGASFYSFSVDPGGSPFSFATSGLGTSNTTTGSVILTVNGSQISTVRYSESTTSAEVVQSLVAAAAPNALVKITTSGAGLLLIQAKQSGASTDYPFSLAAVPDAAGPAYLPSFSIASGSGYLAGGSDGSSGGTVQPVYSFTISNAQMNGYDPSGNIASVSDTIMGSWAYDYDGLNRLIDGHASTGTYTNQYLCWTYDSFGNRQSQSLSSQQCNVGPPSWWARYTVDGTVNTPDNGLNRISAASTGAYAYDGDGNVTSDGVNSYLYDEEDRLCAVQGPQGLVGYQYDALGMRIGKGSISTLSCDFSANGYQPTTDFVIGLNGEQVAELSPGQNGISAWKHTNVFSAGALLGTYDAGGLHLFLTDALGSRRVQTNVAGIVEQNCQSLPFGDQLTCTDAIGTPTEHYFTGKERDMESGLDYFGARHYGSSTGRFMSPDPSGLAYANLTNPQTFNLFSYALNNPLRYIDPTGLTVCDYGPTPNGNGDVEQADDVQECQENGGTVLEDRQSTTVTADDSGNLIEVPNSYSNSLVAVDAPNAPSSDPCANGTLSAAGVNIRNNINQANAYVSTGAAIGGLFNPAAALGDALAAYTYVVGTNGPQDIKNLQGSPGYHNQIGIDAGNISYGVTCPFGGTGCQVAAGLAQAGSGLLNIISGGRVGHGRPGPASTYFDSPSDNASIKQGQAMRAAGCHA